MEYGCQSCGHRDDAGAFYGYSDDEYEIEEVVYVTCPACGDQFTEDCLTEHY